MNSVIETSVVVSTVAIRIRFSGCQQVDTFHLTTAECERFLGDWKAFLSGNGAIGGQYSSEESDRSLLLSLNFSAIAYIEPGKIY